MKTMITVISLAIAIPAMGQIPKGTSTLGGGISLHHKNTEYTIETDFGAIVRKYKETKLSVAPGYGYFVATNFCVGLNVNMAFTHGKSEIFSEIEKSDTRGFGIGPFVRYYIPLDSKLYAFGAAGYSRLWNTIKSDAFDSIDGYVFVNSGTTRSKSSIVDISVGLSYFINPNTAIEGGMLFTHESQGKNADSFNTLALNIGFRIFLRKSE